MSVTVRTTIVDNASPALQHAIASLTDRTQLHEEIGAAVQTLVSEYLIALETVRNDSANALGANKSNFLSKIGEDQTSFAADADKATVSIDNAAMGRAFHDIDIYPTGGRKFLTIPASAESYNKRALEFDDLVLIFSHLTTGNKGPVALAKPTGGKKERLTVLYWLVRAVHQVQDRSLLPSDEQITTSAITAIRGYIGRVLMKQGL